MSRSNIYEKPPRPNSKKKPDKKAETKSSNKLLHLIISLFVISLFSAKPFIEFDENGEPKLALWREEKLIKELQDLEGAEQYVLLAEENGMYPCYSCVDSEFIYLRKGQVWKYGMTTKGLKRRYRGGLPDKRLYYLIQFEGAVEACLMEEKRKIYQYALLPENLARKIPLIRPPGNMRDN